MIVQILSADKSLCMFYKEYDNFLEIYHTCSKMYSKWVVIWLIKYKFVYKVVKSCNCILCKNKYFASYTLSVFI